MYIALEGSVGAVKSTQARLLLQRLRETYTDRRIVLTREPGGSEVADEIRRVVQGTDFREDMDPICEAYLFAASRAQTLGTLVSPIHSEGGIVVADRSFVTSLAFQGEGRQLGFEKVLEINMAAIEGKLPSLILFLSIPASIGYARTHDPDGDKFERMPVEFFERVNSGYNKASQLDLLRNRWRVIDADQDIDSVHSDIWTAVINHLEAES